MVAESMPTMSVATPVSGAVVRVEDRVPIPAERNPAAVYLARLSPGSRKTMRIALERIAHRLVGRTVAKHEVVPQEERGVVFVVPWGELRYQHTAAIRAWLAEVFEPATANKCLSALRGVLTEAWRLGQVGADDYHRAIDIPSIKAQRLPRGRRLTSGEIAALGRACSEDATPRGVRDGALLAVMYVGGLRVAEVVHLDLSDWNPEANTLTVRSGKNRKDRLVFLDNHGSREALGAWAATRGPDAGPLFLPMRKGGRLLSERMTTQGVFDACRRRSREAGVADFTPHDLRRSFVSDLLDAGEDISTVQRMAGHAHVSTTTRYDRRGDEALRRASRKLHFPYHRDLDLKRRWGGQGDQHPPGPIVESPERSLREMWGLVSLRRRDPRS